MIQFFNCTIITEIFRNLPLIILGEILEIRTNECLFGPCPDTMLNYIMVQNNWAGFGVELCIVVELMSDSKINSKDNLHHKKRKQVIDQLLKLKEFNRSVFFRTAICKFCNDCVSKEMNLYKLFLFIHCTIS